MHAHYLSIKTSNQKCSLVSLGKVRFKTLEVFLENLSLLLSFHRIISQRHVMDISQFIALIKFSIMQDIFFANAIFVTSLSAFHHHQTFTYSSRKKNCRHVSCKLTGAYFGAYFASLTSQGTHTFTFDRSTKNISHDCFFFCAKQSNTNSI